MELNEQANTLFLGDLSIHCTERDVRKLFRPFGEIETIRIKRNSNARTNLCYGFVKFSSKEGAEAAMTQLNGTMFLGRCIRIGWAAAKEAQQTAPFDGHVDRVAPKQETAQIHVSFISKQVDAVISEATIRNLFAIFGEVLDVTIKKSQFDKNLNIQNGYGFVHFPLSIVGLTAAIEAVSSLHQVTIDRVTYDCSISHTLEQQLIAWNIPLPHDHILAPPPRGIGTPTTGYYAGNFQQQQPPLLPPYPSQQQSINQPQMMMSIAPPLFSGHLEPHYGHQQQDIMMQQAPPMIMQHHPIMNGGPPRNNPYINRSNQVFGQAPKMYLQQQDHNHASSYHPRHHQQQQQQQQSYYHHPHHAFGEDRVTPLVSSQSFGRPQFLPQYQLPQQPQHHQQPPQQSEFDLGDFARLSVASSSPPPAMSTISDMSHSASFTTSSELLLASVSSSSSLHPMRSQPIVAAVAPAGAASSRQPMQASAMPVDALINQTLSTSEDQVREQK